MKCYTCGKKMRTLTAKNYHYKLSGLANVYLSGIPMYRCACGKEMVEIPKAEELHTVIAGELLRKSNVLIGEEIKFIRKQMRLKAVELAEQLTITPVTLSRWENDKKPIGKEKDKLLRLLFLNNYYNNVIKSNMMSPQIMIRYIQLNNQIARMIHTLRIKRSAIYISKSNFANRTKEELLLTPINIC